MMLSIFKLYAMEVFYVIIPVSSQNEMAFNTELLKLFPYGKLKFMHLHEQKILVVFKDVEKLVTEQHCSEEAAYDIDGKVDLFSRNHPYLKIAVVEMIGDNSNKFFQGYVVRNKKKLITHSNLNDGHIPILKEVFPEYVGPDFEAFSQEFIA